MKVWKIELPKIPLELNKVDDVAEEILKEEKTRGSYNRKCNYRKFRREFNKV